MVTAFFGEVYVQSCALLINEAPAADQAWGALSPEQRLSALKLADFLLAPRVLGKWEAIVARDHDLLLADGLQVRSRVVVRIESNLPVALCAGCCSTQHMPAALRLRG